MSLDSDAIREHYAAARPVYEALATADGARTLAVPDFVGWYVKQDTDEIDAIEDGYPKKGRMTELGRDLSRVIDEVERVLYAVTTYKDPDALGVWEPCRQADDGSTDWRDEPPTPDYADTIAMPAWGDVDLADELKAERGDLDAETTALIEETLDAYIDAYADLYGSRDAVYALDSVGGAYIFGAPEAARPIAEYYADDADARERVFQAFADRTNEYLADKEPEINEEIDGAADVIQPDWVNNVNRQYKAPLSLHKDHDAVVTPIDVDAPTYDLTLLEDVDDALRKRCEDWATSLTDDAHEDRVDRLVRKLWPKWSEGADSWQAALDSWIEHERAQEKRRQRDRSETSTETLYSAENAELTTDPGAVERALDNLDIFRVAEETIVHQWTENKSGVTDNSGAGKKSFVPTWGTGAEGTANYVDEKGVWVDTGDNAYGTAVEMALISEDSWARGQIANGEDWARGVQHLRDLGFEIPVYVPEAGDPAGDDKEYDQMPFWAVKRAAVALGVCPPEAFIERENDDGDTYEGFPGRETYENALEAIEEAGLDHGRETSAQREARETLQQLIDRLDRLPADEDPSDEFKAKDWRRAYISIGELSDTDRDLIDEFAEAADHSKYGLKRHRELYQHQDQHGDVIAEDNTLKLIRGTKRQTEPLLNFDIDVDSFLSLEGGEFMADLTITPTEEPDAEFETQIEPKIFNMPRRFKDEILAERFSTTIDAVEMPDEDVLDYVRKYIHRQDAPRLQGTKQMGLKDGQFVTPNGVITPAGWNEDSDTVFVERSVGAERKFTLSPDTNDSVDTDEVAEILELFSGTRSPEELIPVLGWFYAAAFKPKIANTAGSFNLCAVDGDSGTGKTGTVGTLWQMFGMCENGAEPFSCNDTPFSMITTLSSSRGVPMWFDEYKPSDLGEWQSQRLHDLLKKAATGGTEQRGRPDQTTEEYHLRAPVILTGEEGMMGAAEKRRAIQTTFKHTPTQEGTEYYRKFKQLVGDAYVEDGEVKFDSDAGKDLRMHALAYYQYAADMDDAQFAALWRDAKVTVEEKVSNWTMPKDLDDLEKQGLQTVVFGYKLFRQFAEQMGASASNLPDESDLYAGLRVVADVDGEGRESHLDRYTQLLSRVALDGRLEAGTHFKVVDQGGPDEELRVNIGRAHDKVTKYARDHDITEDLLSQSKDYKSRYKEANERDGTYVVNYSQNTPPISRAVGIDIERAQNDLEGFDRSSFVPEAEEYDSEADETPDGMVLAALDPGRYSFRATVATVSEGEYSREAQGELRGPNNTFISFIVPGGNDNPFDDNEGETVDLSNVKVKTDDDGLLEAIINDAVGVNVVDTQMTSLPSGDGDGGGGGGSEAAADGGQAVESADTPDTDDAERKGTRAVIDDVVEYLEGKEAKEEHEIVTAMRMSDAYDHDADMLKHALEQARNQGRLEMTGNGLRSV